MNTHLIASKNMLNDMTHTFIPLTTTQGLSEAELNNYVNRRDVIIWGGGHLGRVIKRILEKCGLTITAFCDNNSTLQGSLIDGVNIIPPSLAFKSAKQNNAVLIIASIQYRHEMQSQCNAEGLKLKEHYLLYLHISRPEALIDISDKDNTFDGQTKKVMSLSSYQHVVEKLLKERPLLSHINLSAWGDSMLHPSLNKIIELTEKVVPCTVSTKLNTISNLEEIIQAEPSQFVVSVHHSDHLPTNQASMSILQKNLRSLSRFIEKHRPSTEFKVMYHLYKDNQEAELDNLAKLCSDLKLKFVTTMAYLDPYEKTLQYCKGETLPPEENALRQQLAWDLDHAIKLSHKDQALPCLCQRLFPIINWDLSVSLCEIYSGPEIAANFLEIKMSDLLNLRHSNNHCRECQSYSLHRLDIDVLQRRHPTEKLLLSERDL